MNAASFIEHFCHKWETFALTLLKEGGIIKQYFLLCHEISYTLQESLSKNFDAFEAVL
jgi:hypothetical protein